MKTNLEYRYADIEYRETDDGLGVVTGTVIRYGDVATLPWFTEEFKAGWVSNADDVMIANRMHLRSEPLAASDTGDLVIRDTDERMVAEITLPDTTHGRNAAVELGRKLLRGLSLEFIATKDEYDYKRGHRVIVEGRMFGFGVVDRPAYPGSVAEMKRAEEYRQHYGLHVPERPKEPAPRRLLHLGWG